MELNGTIIENDGEALEYGWYKYKDHYYRVFHGQVLSHTTELKIDTEKGYFLYKSNDPSIVILVKGNYIGTILNTHINNVDVLNDLYFITNTVDGRGRELRSADLVVFRADDIYQIESGEYVGVSNGVHNLIDENLKPSPVSEYKIRFNKDTGKYENFFRNEKWVELKM